MRADLEPFCNSLDIVDGDVAFAPLDATEISSVHLDVIGKVLLANAERLPEIADICSYDLA